MLAWRVSRAWHPCGGGWGRGLGAAHLAIFQGGKMQWQAQSEAYVHILPPCEVGGGVNGLDAGRQASTPESGPCPVSSTPQPWQAAAPPPSSAPNPC